MKEKITEVNIVGGGLAGVECAYLLANNGIKVNLYEMKPTKFSPAHKATTLAEVVCSNSFKNIDIATSSGLLKAEMERFGSIVLEIAKETSVPAGGALAVDRDKFSSRVDSEIRAHKNIKVFDQEITEFPSKEDEIRPYSSG